MDIDKLREGSIITCLGKVEHIKKLLIGKKNLLQVGFNGGHSADLLLSYSDPDSTLVSFDLGEHSYVNMCNSEIEKKFPGRHTLILGDSMKTLPEFTINNMAKYDFIFVDGGHTYEIASSDFDCALKLGKEGSTIVLDDVIFTKELEASYSKGPTDVWKLNLNLFKNTENHEYGWGYGMAWGVL